MHLNKPTLIPTRLSLLTPAGLLFRVSFIASSIHITGTTTIFPYCFTVTFIFNPASSCTIWIRFIFAKIENKRICCKYNANHKRKNGENVLKNCNIIWSSIKFPIKATLKGKKSHNFFYGIFRSLLNIFYLIGLRYTLCWMKKDNECIVKLHFIIYRSYHILQCHPPPKKSHLAPWNICSQHNKDYCD